MAVGVRLGIIKQDPEDRGKANCFTFKKGVMYGTGRKPE